MCTRTTPIVVSLAFAIAAFGQPAEAPPYTWTATGPLHVARSGACAAAFPDGHILVAGGPDATGPLRAAEIY